ncbi:chemotaxis protein CheD [Acidovorax facilis]|uniref:chemotaxis protein CheD n=1 Tax=Acidovorax facilis TaxID=12917 RepID=UPI003CF84FE3
MCHALLPQRQRAPGIPLDGRFTNEAIEILLNHLQDRGISPVACQIQLFGGARLFTQPELTVLDVGQRNIEVARQVLTQLSLPLKHSDVGGTLPRRLHFDLQNGQVNNTYSPQITKERM